MFDIIKVTSKVHLTQRERGGRELPSNGLLSFRLLIYSTKETQAYDDYCYHLMLPAFFYLYLCIIAS